MHYIMYPQTNIEIIVIIGRKEEIIMKLKKIISLLLATVIVMSVFAVSTIALADESNDFEYTVLDDGTAEITKYIGSSTTVKIPDIIEDHKVTSIKFSYDLFPDIQKLYIPYSVTQIKNLNEYNYHGFENCYNLTDIIVDEKNNTFISQDGVLFTKDMTELLAYPKNKETTSYTVPDSVINIKDTFSYCKNLVEIKIPASTKNIDLGYYADNTLFHNSKKLNNIYVDPNNSAYSSQNGILFNKDMTELIRYPIGKSSSYYEIPDTVTCLGWYSFLNCNNIQEIFIPLSITDIGWYTFGICESLSEIYYAGNETQWKNINIYTENYALYKAEIHYNQQPKPEESPILPDGTDEEYVIGSKNGASVHCSYNLTDFISVTVDYETVDPSNYTLSEGSTILTFKSKYLDTLSVGKHIITQNYNNASVSSVLTVIAKPTEDNETENTDITTTQSTDVPEETVTDKSEATNNTESDTYEKETTSDKTGTSAKSPSTGSDCTFFAILAALICSATAVLLTVKTKRIQN